MARFGQSFLASLTQPSYGEGLFELGTALGQAPAAAADRKAKQSMLDSLKEALVSNDPSLIEQKGVEVLQTNPEQGEKLIKRANTIRAAQDETRRVKGLQGGLIAIQQASSRGIPLSDLREAQQSVIALGGTRKDIDDAYKAGQKKIETSEYSFSEETILIDGKETRVQIATNKNDPTDFTVTTIGTPPAKETEGKPSISEQLGIDVDLATVDGIRTARNHAINTLQNASLANTLDDMLQRKLPAGAVESVEMVRKIDPKFESNEDLLEKAGRFSVLNTLGEQDVAGVAALIERTVTSTTENDLRAVAELDRFRGSKDIGQALKDWSLMVTAGRLSEETRKEYAQVMTGLEKLAKQRISNSIDRFILAAVTDKEREAAETARKYFGIDSTARIVQ